MSAQLLTLTNSPSQRAGKALKGASAGWARKSGMLRVARGALPGLLGPCPPSGAVKGPNTAPILAKLPEFVGKVVWHETETPQ